MQAWQAYCDSNCLKLQWIDCSSSDSELVPVMRICSITNELLMLLTDDCCLYKGHLDKTTNILNLQLYCEKVYDVDYCAQLEKLFVIIDRGIVLTLDFKEGVGIELPRKTRFDDWQTLSFDPLEISEDGIHIKRVCCSRYGAVFVTSSNDIYCIGSCGDIFSVDIEQPKHIRLFDEVLIDEVIDIVGGDKFFAFLLRTSYDEKLDILHLNSGVSRNKLPNTAVPTRLQSTASKCIHAGTTLMPLMPSLHHRNFGPERLKVNNNHNSNESLQSCSGNSNSSISHDFEEHAVRGQLLRQGYALLHTQVYIFSTVSNNDILGASENTKRGSMNHIKKLDEIGVCSIVSGKNRTVVRTLDGRLFHLGDMNSKLQLQPNVIDEQTDLMSTPTEDDSRLCDLQDSRTVLMNGYGKLYARNGTKLLEEKDFLALQKGSTESRVYPLFLAAGNVTVYNKCKFRQQFQSYLVALQKNLKQLLQSMGTVNILQMFHHQQQDELNVSGGLLQFLCLNYRKVLYLIALAVKSLEAFYRGDFENPADIVFVKHYRDFIAIFEDYTCAICDIYAVDGFSELSKAPKEPPDLVKVFQQPLLVVPIILQLIEQLTKSFNGYAEHLLAWQIYSRQNTINQEVAEHTLDFWQRNERNIKIRHLQRRHRRVILTSTSVPVKLSQHGLSISSPTFILFSDCLCQLSSRLYTFPLVTMWVKVESDTAIRITTPEKSFVLTARNHHDKMVWYDQLESTILAALGRPNLSKLSIARTTAYVFSNSHSKYAGVHAYGRWRNGLMHGTCYLEYPDGRFYFGEMRNGEIEGYGKMVIPSVGLYEGTFKLGKFHGHGTYETKDEVYEGHFRDGLFHGHGFLRNNNYTYVGEYQANAKHGYGVLDDMLTGDKYMGMFVENKRIGSGTCITMAGDYFEGIFTSDELAGAGIAVFEDDYYYEGELNMNGPCGKGVYYMPSGNACSKNAGDGDDDKTNQILCGNIVSGHLSGNWQNIKVISGNVAINQKFLKYPNSIGNFVVDSKRKWRSLFENFEEQVLGVRLSSEKATTATAAATMHWNRIAVFMTTQREHEKALEQENLSAELRQSYFARNILMGFGSKSFDGLNLEGIFNDLKSNSHSLRSQSQERLSDDISFFQQPSNCDEFPSLGGQMANWANDTMSGCGEHSSINGDFVQSSLGTTASSLRSSYDSVFNANTSFNNNNNSISSAATCSQNTLEYVPSFGINSPLNQSDIVAIREYLGQAFKDRHHPFYILNQRITNCFYISYGCWKVKPSPILAKQAMQEWECITRQIYKFIRKLFPALPDDDYYVIESTREVISHITLLYPIVLTEGIYSTLFVLYANKYSCKDEIYRQNIIHAQKLNDNELALQLGLENTLLAIVGTKLFADALQTLKQVQEKHNPKDMLDVIEHCMQLITDAHKLMENTNTVILAADSMMPLTLFLMLRAAVPHLGAELAILEDLTGGDNFQFEMNGIAGYCYTTLKAAYEHITSKPLYNK